MKRPVDAARRFLELADRDIRAFHKLAPDPDIDDAVVGFHAQQAVEKCLKAVLARREIAFRKIHDLRALLDILANNCPPGPPMREELAELSPFAVVLRYELTETGALDRSLANSISAPCVTGLARAFWNKSNWPRLFGKSAPVASAPEWRHEGAGFFNRPVDRASSRE